MNHDYVPRETESVLQTKDYNFTSVRPLNGGRASDLLFFHYRFKKHPILTAAREAVCQTTK